MSNLDGATEHFVSRWDGLLDQIAEAQEELKILKAQAKDDGFNNAIDPEIIASLCSAEKVAAVRAMAEQLRVHDSLAGNLEPVSRPAKLDPPKFEGNRKDRRRQLAEWRKQQRIGP